MFKHLATATSRHPKVVLVISAIFVVVAGAVGSLVIPRMSSAGYSDPGSDSYAAYDLLENEFNAPLPHLSIAIGQLGTAGAADDEAVAAQAEEIIADFAQVDGVSKIDSYWSLGRPAQMKSTDGSLGLVLLYVDAKTLDKRNAVARTIIDDTPDRVGNVDVVISGAGGTYNGINKQITEDIKFAEMISIPLTLLLLLFVFGTAVAAGMPLFVGVSAILGALFGVWAISLFTDVSVFALNLITGLGLGLGIDYALLIVNRFREELGRGKSVEEAVQETVHTAGRTVMVSGIAVGLTLSSMIMFPQPFLRSFAYAGVSVCIMAIAGALIPLPAALRLFGRRIDSLRIRRGDLTPKDEGIWSRVARFVMRRPWSTTLLTLVALVSLALPALGAQFSQVDDRVLNKENPAAQAAQLFRDNFSSNESSPIDVIFTSDVSDARVARVARDIAQLPEIVRVETQAGIYTRAGFQPLEGVPGWPAATMETDSHVRLVAISNVSARTAAGMSLTHEMRDLAPDSLVGGAAADYTDSQEGIARQMPAALLWVAIATLIVLFLFTGSVLLPFKAIALNVLSLGSAMGVLTWMFQNGNLQWLTGEYTVTGALDTSSLVIVAIVTFGLSMDYEVFLLSRIKEEHDAGSDTTEAVALGLQRSGRIITAAALLLAVVFAAFVTSSVTSIKMLGFGIAFAILLDATVVRGLLVPALMRIAGRYNWWAPRPLRRLHDRFGLSD